MPKAQVLTDAKIRSIKAKGRYGDALCPTLHLFAQENARGGIRLSWVQRLVVRGRRKEIGLGGYPLVSLRQARKAATRNRRKARGGGNPLKRRRAARRATFREAAQAVIAMRSADGSWKEPGKMAGVWDRSFRLHAYPAIAEAPVDDITQSDLIAILKPLAEGKPATAAHLRKRICAVLSWAQAHGHRADNPCDALEAALPSAKGRRRHRKAIAHADVAEALGALRAGPAGGGVRACLKFIAATACRSQEAARATWAEIDMESRTWTIPGERMKLGVEHAVPLNDLAVEALREARGGGGLVFAGERSGRAIGWMPLLRAWKLAAGDDSQTVHGLRSAFRNWCGDTGVAREVAEAALTHSVPGIEGAYLRTRMVERRRPVMADWAAYLTGGGDG
ncbi:MAG: tyrosine-type recombinase/integrase [Gammaproteobacteria bacterium]|nr:tyrosine-type recombinase/integrase [Gammaproteobacteria bacterium]